MYKFKTLKSVLAGFICVTLSACGGKDLADHPDLLTASAHCNTAADFGGCLLSSYVNHPASLSFPEKLKFSPYYAQTIETGYDRELRRKDVNKFVDADVHKDRNTRNFTLKDMYIHATSQTPEGTEKAISLLENFPSLYLNPSYLDPLLEQWMETPDIFETSFAHALLMKYSKKWMLESSAWNKHPGMTSGQSSFEVLSRAFKKVGDQASADKMIADMKKQKFYPLRQMLAPVYAGKKSLTHMDGEALKKAGFFVVAAAPIINQQIERNTAPKTILSNLAFATLYGQGDNQGYKLADKALSYAYEKNDKRSIIRFTDQVLDIPIDFSNGLLTTLTRANRLSQDLVLVQYLSVLGDQKRIEKIAKKWEPLSKRLPNGKLPNWAGASISNYMNILDHAGHTDDIQTYLQALVDNKDMQAKDKSKFKTNMTSQAVTVQKIKKIETQHSTQRLQSFYGRCAREGGISSHKYDVRIYCANKIQTPNRRIMAKLKLAQTLYQDGNTQKGRVLTQEALTEAEACNCVKERPFSNQSYQLADIIIAELEHSAS